MCFDGSVAIVGVPWDGSASFRGGMRHAPNAIRNASESIESYSTIFRRDLKDIGLVDMGNMLLPEDPMQAMDAISSLLFKLHKNGMRTICIGGDHSIAVGIVSGLLKVYDKLQVIAFDAHSDWRDEYDGSNLSHACTIRRLVELVGDQNVLVFGARSFIGDEPIELYKSLNELAWLIKVGVPTHVSIDLDVLDSSVAPAVGNPEPNGIQFEELLMALQNLHLKGCNVVSVDVVELCPQYDSGVTAIVAAKVIVECVVWLLERRDCNGGRILIR